MKLLSANVENLREPLNERTLTDEMFMTSCRLFSILCGGEDFEGTSDDLCSLCIRLYLLGLHKQGPEKGNARYGHRPSCADRQIKAYLRICYKVCFCFLLSNLCSGDLSFTVTTLWEISRRRIDDMFLYFSANMLWHFIQIVAWSVKVCSLGKKENISKCRLQTFLTQHAKR